MTMIGERTELRIAPEDRDPKQPPYVAMGCRTFHVASFEASPGHVIPDAVGKLGRSVADKLVHGSRQTDR